MKKSTNWVYIPLSIIVIIIGILSVGYYNTIQTLDEKQNAAAAEVINQYKRRADLMTNLANTVKSYATHEQTIFTEIAASRAQLNQMHINPQDFQDANKLQSFEKAQVALKDQFSRLLIMVENYPDLKANSLYQNLMVQLEGTENRTAVARNRYIETVREYNTTIRKVPYIFFANIFGYQPLPQFSVEDSNIDNPPVMTL